MTTIISKMRAFCINHVAVMTNVLQRLVYGAELGCNYADAAPSVELEIGRVLSGEPPVYQVQPE